MVFVELGVALLLVAVLAMRRTMRLRDLQPSDRWLPKDREDRIRTSIDGIPAMVWSLTADGALDFVNQRWLDYAGLSLTEALEQPLRPIHPEDVSGILEKWQEDMASGRKSEGEVRLRSASGEYRRFLIRTVPVFDERGTITKWYGTSTDIEDLKRAEERLAQSERHLAEAQRTAHVGSWDWDLREQTGIFSDECRRIFGVEPHQAFPRELSELVHPHDRERVHAAVQRAVADGEPYELYYRIVRRDGSERTLHSISRVVHDVSGTPIRIFGATQDVTELKRAEAELKNTTEQLRALSARLQSTREEERTLIAREIHDELGATLTSARWEIERIKRRVSESGPADLGERVTAALALIDTTIAQVRRIASDLRPAVLDVLGVEEAIEWQAQQFQDRTGITVHCDSSGSGDELTPEQATAVFRIFQEALTNTLRHANATRIDVTMEEDAGAYILTIKDNGRGITEDELARDSSIGLLGMRERASLIGGDISVGGIEGEGTTVTVRLPISP